MDFLPGAKYSSRLDNFASGKAAEALARHNTLSQSCEGLRQKREGDEI